MHKKIMPVITSILIYLATSNIAFAASIELPYFGTTSETKYLWADSTHGDDDFTSVQYVSRGNATINYYKNVDGHATSIGSAILTGSGTVTPPGGTAAIKLVSNDGSEVYLTFARTTNPNNTEIYFGESSNNGGGGGSTGGGGGVVGNTGDCGCVFNTPGWQKYMGKINDIIAAIPPAPNWGKVANTFRDSIVPAMTSDMSNLLGKAPSLPSTPSTPSGPGKPDLPKNPGLTQPNGKDGIGDSGFTSNDIKDEAPKIEEREDPTGGFDILDPVGQLPSQDEFKEHQPDEGKVKLPKPPKEQENKAPDPGDVEGKAPTPPEKDNPAPGAPKEQENKAPDPGDVKGTAPKPKEPKITVPSAPEEKPNKAPTPGKGSTGKPPIPGGDSGSYPMPGSDNSKAPIPGVDTSKAPIPKGG